jgi:hypothetical protein
MGKVIRVLFSGFVLGLSISAHAQIEHSGEFFPPSRTQVLETRHGNSVSGHEGYRSGPWMPAFRNPTRDPISGVQYSAVLYGNVESSYNPFSDYSLWRYVTVYRSEFLRESISDLPAIHQSCFDSGKYPIGNWQISRSISVELRSSLRAGEIGLGAEVSASISQGRTFSLQRSLIVPEGVEADFYPLLRQESWVGTTFIQTYEPSTGKLGYIPPGFWDQIWADYPYHFELKNVSTVFEVERKNARKCSKSKTAEASSGPLPEIIFPLE